MLGYAQALEAAGETVVACEQFGDYQGTWLARLSSGKFAYGYFGSCTVCDNFEAEVSVHYPWENGSYEWNIYNNKLKEFGQKLVEDNLYDYQELRDKLAPDAAWDYDRGACLAFLDHHKPK